MRGALQARRSVSSLLPSEVSKFSKIGRAWWDTDSVAGTGPLHFMNPARVSFIRAQMATLLGREQQSALDHLRGLTVLDVGCGGGLLAESLARLGAQVTAIDPSVENIVVAKEHAAADPVTARTRYLHSTVEEIAKTGEQFDVVTTLEVVEHVQDPQAFLASCAQCLAPHGSLFVSTVNRTPKAYLLTILLAESCLRMLPEGTHQFEKYVTPAELTGMLEGSLGMDVLATKGLVPEVHAGALLAKPSVASALRYWTVSDSDLDVNYIAHAVRQLAR